MAARQAGVLTTRQLLDGGLSHDVIYRMARRWGRPAQGLFLTAPATWESAAWAGLLRGGPTAVLGADTAGFLHDAVRDAPRKITVWTTVGRDGFAVDDWKVHFRRGARKGVGSPPRTSVEVSLLDMARTASEDGLVAALARALAQHRTTPGRIAAELERRERTQHSSVVTELCAKAAAGVESALEWRFAAKVLRPHGLPLPERQVRSNEGRIDSLYREQRLIVELDGERDHTAWSKDMMRDNAHLADIDLPTLRYGWDAVTGSPCAVASQVALVLRKRGWRGYLHHCPSCPGSA